MRAINKKKQQQNSTTTKTAQPISHRQYDQTIIIQHRQRQQRYIPTARFRLKSQEILRIWIKRISIVLLDFEILKIYQLKSL